MGSILCREVVPFLDGPLLEVPWDYNTYTSSLESTVVPIKYPSGRRFSHAFCNIIIVFSYFSNE